MSDAALYHVIRWSVSDLGHTCEGFDHGVGHSLLLLCDAKAPKGQKSK
jgi:hypothetical protein